MDDKEIAVASLVLLGTTIESHLEAGLSTPLFYQALDLAVELAKEVGISELTDRLTCLQMEVGEHNAKLLERLTAISDEIDNSPDLSELLERLTRNED